MVEQLKGDYVVVTVPLGVLKNGSIKFIPELPSWKTNAINKMCHGNLSKVVVEFPECFWPEKDIFGYAPPPPTNPKTTNGRLKVSDYDSSGGRYFMFWNLKNCTSKNILVSLVSGDSADEIEKMSGEEIRDEIFEIFKLRKKLQKLSFWGTFLPENFLEFELQNIEFVVV